MLDTPEKSWTLPEYVQGEVERAVEEVQFSPVKRWKGLQLCRGTDRKFVPNKYVDMEARQASKFIYEEAESTSRSTSSDLLGSVEDGEDSKDSEEDWQTEESG